jgi:hypothetical protein
MKRSVLLLTAVAVVVTPLGASAAPTATKRVLTYDYSGFQAGGASMVGSFSSENGCQAMAACWDFDTTKGEKTIELTAEDSTGAPIGIQVFYDDAYADNVVLFCGAGKITVSPKRAHTISVRTSAQDCDGVATSGTLTATVVGTK